MRWVVALVIAVTMGLMGCRVPMHENAWAEESPFPSPSPATTTGAPNPTRHTMADTQRRELIIPDPHESVDGVVLYMRDDFATGNEWEAYCTIDLPFVDLEDFHVVQMTAASFPSIAGAEEIRCVGVQGDTTNGSCLLITGYTREVANADMEEHHYLVLVDYRRDICFVQEFDPDIDYFHREPDMAMWIEDVTGDGIPDIIVQSNPHKYEFMKCYEVYRYADGRLHPLLAKRYGCGDTESFFTGHYLDAYQVVVNCERTGLSRTISLLSCGFSQDELEMRSDEDVEDTERLWDGEGIYRNGRVERGLELDSKEPESAQVRIGDDGKPVFVLRYTVYVHYWMPVCHAYLHFAYDERTERLVLVGSTVDEAPWGGYESAF